MKLNRIQKDAIVRAIMLDVPKPDRTNIHKEVQEAIVKAMSPECRKVYKATPKALVSEHTGDTTYNGVNWDTRSVIRGDVDGDKLKEILRPHDERNKAYYDTEKKLYAAVHACTTLKQLQTMMPEFTKYFPTEAQPTKNLPAVANLVADLSKLGWPKDKTKSL